VVELYHGDLLPILSERLASRSQIIVGEDPHDAHALTEGVVMVRRTARPGGEQFLALVGLAPGVVAAPWGDARGGGADCLQVG